MSVAARKFLFGTALFLGAGTAVGWVYGQAMNGLLVAVLLTLIWQIRQLLSFERAVRTDNFDDFRHGEGIWEQIVARFRFERSRAIRRKGDYRRLLKEIRKSTDAMPDGAVILDANNEIVLCNRAAKTLAGLKRKKDRGQRIDNILRDPLISQLLGDSNFDQTVEFPSPVAEGRWLHGRVVPYGAEQKLLMLRDITERRQLNKMRRDFAANASHELRSPLTVISGYLDSLADDEEMPATWETPVRQMQAQSHRMQRIVTDLLELSRLESAGTATSAAIDMVRLLERIRSDYESPANEARIILNLQSAVELLGVESEIESVVVNLLSNAMRYTPREGEVTITWVSSPDGADLSVSDTGDGIDAELIPRLTERFFRVDRGRSRDDGGVGLGLAIVKHVLARHDALLRITSEPGAGSEFCCHFPPERVVVAPPLTLS
ncbi:MAG: phosphate regulon sensor histidine kinase PhoR [Gammaproteobacteria bacterium]|nr:phosphate regulon sensor histidine kinase PhoR [Gammaproteobacteria bacterium]